MNDPDPPMAYILSVTSARFITAQKWPRNATDVSV